LRTRLNYCRATQKEKWMKGIRRGGKFSFRRAVTMQLNRCGRNTSCRRDVNI